MVPIRSHVICFEPLAALAQWLVPPASSELCQHVAAPNVGAMHIVLEGLSPSGNSSGFPDLHLAYFCHLDRTWKQFKKPKRGQRGPPDACPSETEGHTNSGVFLAGTGTGVGIPVALAPHQVAFSDQKSGLCTPKIPMLYHHFPYRMGPPSYKLVYKPWNNPHEL